MDNKKIITIAIVAVIAVGAGAFYGGTAYEKNSLSSQGLLRNSNPSQFGNRGGQQPGQPRQSGAMGSNGTGRGGDLVTGQIISKDDKSITVKSQDGSSKIVFFSDSTAIGKATQGSSADLAVGENVLANGKSSADGSLSAQNIQIRPATN
ncbi:MAG: hypothetical protein WC120_00945 [Parcubacteria group bacterium]